MMKPLASDNAPDLLSADTVSAMEELGLALKTIYLDLKQQGYRLVDGKYVKTKGYETQSIE